MDMRPVLKRLDKIEKALGITDKPEKKIDIYDRTKIYIGIKDGCPYIMAGHAPDYYRFHSFGAPLATIQGWDEPITCGQECLDYHANAGFDIHAFDDTREAFQFFIDHLK